jgi:peroxiredoxin
MFEQRSSNMGLVYIVLNMLSCHDCDQTLRGNPAPPLVLKCVAGKELHLQPSSDAYYTLLIFHRGLECAVCRIYLSKLDLLMGSWALKGLRIIVASGENEQQATQQATQWGLHNIDMAYGMTTEQASAWQVENEAESTTHEALIAQPVMYLLSHQLEIMKRCTLTGVSCKLPKLESLRTILKCLALRASTQLALQLRTLPV